ncbi:hypothetical protein XA68_15711 [Ophiocordyceps unilateralis]|uniref:Ubiquitin-like domain-containing protein n=1 Tax=Ophiocordyceps unilateralis TaxID=268505 RepID=A0A2A9PKR2_OPHUN|nr:hypothetical protein XA68_15711 [Ophiocordyceps unilateralis]
MHRATTDRVPPSPPLPDSGDNQTRLVPPTACFWTVFRSIAIIAPILASHTPPPQASTHRRSALTKRRAWAAHFLSLPRRRDPHLLSFAQAASSAPDAVSSPSSLVPFFALLKATPHHRAAIHPSTTVLQLINLSEPLSTFFQTLCPYSPCFYIGLHTPAAGTAANIVVALLSDSIFLRVTSSRPSDLTLRLAFTPTVLSGSSRVKTSPPPPPPPPGCSSYAMPPNRRITIQPGVESSRSTSHPSEEEESTQYDYNSNTDDDLEDEGDYDEEAVFPSDSASAINELPPSRPRSGRSATRHHRVSRHEAQYASVQSHALNSPSVDTPEEFNGYYSQPFQPLPAQRGGGGGGGYYNGRGHVHPYPHNHGNHYIGGYPAGGQMVPYNYGPNPFAPMSNNSSGASYFGAEPRPMYDMMPYQPNFYNPQQYLAAQMQHQLHLTPPAPPATEVPAQPTSPAPPKEPPVDIEKIKREAEEAAKKLQEDKQKAINDQIEREAQIRKDAEESFRRQLEEAKKQQEEAQRDIARAKAEADKAAVERIQAEQKAAEERSRLQAEEMKRAEEKAIREYEAKAKAEEERKKRELDERIRIEEAAKAQVHAILKLEAEAKAKAEKKAAEDAERLKHIQEEAKLKAELDALSKIEADKEAAKKAAEADAAAKKEHEALRKRMMDEAKAKLEEAAKKTDQGNINFKDAVGRKFNFPYDLVKSWQGMEDLIKQAFLHVEVIGPHVQEGHYDLTGPNGEIILPSIWEKVIQPDWNISMTMWPVDKRPALGNPKPLFRGRGGPTMPPPPPMGPHGMEPPPEWHPERRRHPHIPNIDIIEVGPHPKTRKSATKKNSKFSGFFATKKPTKKKTSKK